MRVLIAPQEFKGTLTAVEAAEAIAAGIRAARPEWELDLFPIADGGPGTVDALLRGVGGRRMRTQAHDARGRETVAEWALLGNAETGSSAADGSKFLDPSTPPRITRTAVIEMAAASGLVLLPRELRDPRVTSTRGTGELILAALDAGARTILIGAGGSATNDGGTGALTALGARFLDASGAELPPGGAALERLDHIDLTRLDPSWRSASAIVLSDIENPLLGALGCSRIFGPQKGASTETVEVLERGLARLDEVAKRQLGASAATTAGSGAAGGLAYGLATFGGATISAGFDAIAERTQLEKRWLAAEVVVTGEGALDAQTGFGKGPARLAARVRTGGKRCVLFAGRVGDPAATALFDQVIEVSPGLAERAPDAGQRLSAAAEAWARRI